MTTSAKQIRLPDDTKRLVIIGRTGSGKTYAGIWHLSLRDWTREKWIIFDFKGDPSLALLPARPLTFAQLPTEPGLYILRPLPNQDAEVNDYLWRVWRAGNIGLYFDEGYMVAKSDALDAILTQGRSKHIPVIILSQRPVWLSRFAFSEAEFYQTFSLNDIRDRKTVTAFQPAEVGENRLPEFNSHYYDVGRDTLNTLGPVPTLASLLPRFPIVEPVNTEPEPARIRVI